MYYKKLPEHTISAIRNHFDDYMAIRMAVAKIKLCPEEAIEDLEALADRILQTARMIIHQQYQESSEGFELMSAEEKKQIEGEIRKNLPK